jgi:3-isopropylmalate/(R)-2-methylmalate dehydratase large subunit
MDRPARTLFDKVWDSHVVAKRGDGRELVYMDRHVLHELHGPHAFARLAASGRTVRRPDLTFGVLDHALATLPGRDEHTNPDAAPFALAMRKASQRYGFRLFDVGDPEQGIGHVVAPELAIVLPGTTYACPDSHACTVGGIGAVAFACGTSELEHVLATQTMALHKPPQMRVVLEGTLGPHVGAKDVILDLIRREGIAGARGFAVEYAGPVVEALSIEARLTLCNMTIEMGARTGYIAPDEKTFSWLRGRRYAPRDDVWERALTVWRTLRSDEEARFERTLVVDCDSLEPIVTWGTNQSHAIPVNGRIPDPDESPAEDRAALQRALAYMGLTPGMVLEGLPIDRVFIGSCTNARIEDLEHAAGLVRGRHVATGVRAVVVPGSTSVKREAEARGLDTIFRSAGFEWHESGCSMCAGANGDLAAAGQRTIATSNRNFENRQGPGVRTHLASPAVAAASAVTGCISDPRTLLAKGR